MKASRAGRGSWARWGNCKTLPYRETWPRKWVASLLNLYMYSIRELWVKSPCVYTACTQLCHVCTGVTPCVLYIHLRLCMQCMAIHVSAGSMHECLWVGETGNEAIHKVGDTGIVLRLWLSCLLTCRNLMAQSIHLVLVLIMTPTSWRLSLHKEVEYTTTSTTVKRYIAWWPYDVHIHKPTYLFQWDDFSTCTYISGCIWYCHIVILCAHWLLAKHTAFTLIIVHVYTLYVDVNVFGETNRFPYAQKSYGIICLLKATSPLQWSLTCSHLINGTSSKS